MKINKNISFACRENPRVKTFNSYNVKVTQESRKTGVEK